MCKYLPLFLKLGETCLPKIHTSKLMINDTVQNKIILSILSLPFQCAFKKNQKERKKILYEKTKYIPTRNFILYTKKFKKLPFKC